MSDTKQLDFDETLEDAIAISDAFHCNKERYQKFYERFADEVNGFVGIYALLVPAAKVFTTNHPGWGVDAEWNESVDAYVKAIHEKAMAAAETPKFDQDWFLGFVKECYVNYPPAPKPKHPRHDGHFVFEMEDREIEQKGWEEPMYLNGEGWTAHDRNFEHEDSTLQFATEEAAMTYFEASVRTAISAHEKVSLVKLIPGGTDLVRVLVDYQDKKESEES